MSFKGRALAAASACFVLAVRLISAQTSVQLTCQKGNPGTDVVQLCTGSGTLAAEKKDTYTFSIDSEAEPGETLFEGFDVDMDIRLSSVTGDVNLQVEQPSGSLRNSTRSVGEDIIFISKRDISSGTYKYAVTGKALTSNYILMVYITYERELNPVEEVTVGQILLECCNQDQNSCVNLKQKYPSLADNDNSTNPNYCYIPGNVCTREGRMEEISMPGNSMACRLPANSLKSLSRLERIDLSNNRISGNLTDIAEIFSTANNLEYLDLSNNAISGNFSQACGLSKTGFIEQLSLAGNLINGSIPACILGLKNLVELRLDNNALRGTIPSIPGAKSSKLVYFTAANQTKKAGGFSGSLPASIGDLSRLAYLDFSGNALTGNLPALPPSIKRVDLASNYITNSGYAEGIPAAYGSLGQLVSLKLRNNSLSGFLPAEIATLPKLQYLDISRNVLSSTLPPDWSRAMNLGFLKLDHNTLTGTIPGTMASLRNLIVLDLSSNDFSGTMDDFAQQTPSGNSEAGSIIRFFSANGNELSATLAASRGQPGSTMNLTFDLGGNSFSGAWPSWLFEAIHQAPAKIYVNLSGSVLTCPSNGFEVDTPVPQGYLEGLSCQTTSSSGAVQQIPLDKVVRVEEEETGMSGGAIFGVIVAIFVTVGAVAYIIWYWQKRAQRQRAAAAAAFGSGFGNYPPQGRGGGYSSFSDDHQAWADPVSGQSTPNRAANTAPNKQKQVGLASVPLSQRGEF